MAFDPAIVGSGALGAGTGVPVSVQGQSGGTPIATNDAATELTLTANVAVTTNPQTFTLGTLPLPLPELGTYKLVVYQGATGQNITGMSLIFQDTVGASISTTYPIVNTAGTNSTLAQAASSVVSYSGLVSTGVYKNVSLQVTWAGAPTAVTNGLVVQLHLLDPSAIERVTAAIGLVAYLTTAASTANQVLIAAPGAGLSIYVTAMEGSNAGASLSTATFYDGSPGTAKYTRVMAASGGGFVTNLQPQSSWNLTTGNACTVTPSAAVQQYFSANYYIAV